MIELSVIIQTYDRADYLKDALASVLGQTLDRAFYEIIVINNGSANKSKGLVENLSREYGRAISYFSEPAPGLHNGRHRGAKESRGNILVYVDDDIIAFPGWLEAIKSTFSHAEIVLVGGKNLPKWGGEVPEWMTLFWVKNKYGRYNGYLTLLDFGEKRKGIPAEFVWGCNFSIRKSVMYECGGFHPDSMPQDLIRFRGDGETGLCVEIMEKGYKAIYEPKAAVYHRVPKERLTVHYFCQRFFNQGISDSYTEIRKTGKLNNPRKRKKYRSLWRLKLKYLKRRHPILKKAHQAYERGYQYHQEQVKSDPELLAHVLKRVYY